MPSKRDWELPLSAVTRLAGIWGAYRVINDRAVFTELNILATDGQTTRVNGRINSPDFITMGFIVWCLIYRFGRYPDVSAYCQWALS